MITAIKTRPPTQTQSYLNPKTAIVPLCSIYRHVGHDGWSAGSSDITFKGNPKFMIQAKFGLAWSCGFRGEHRNGMLKIS